MDAFEHGPDAVNARPPSIVVSRPTLPVLSGEENRMIGGFRIAAYGNQTDPGERMEHVGRAIGIARRQQDEDIRRRGIEAGRWQRECAQDDGFLAAIRDFLKGNAALCQVAPTLHWKHRHPSALRGLDDAGEKALHAHGRQIDHFGIVNWPVIRPAHFKPHTVSCRINAGELFQRHSRD